MSLSNAPLPPNYAPCPMMHHPSNAPHTIPNIFHTPPPSIHNSTSIILMHHSSIAPSLYTTPPYLMHHSFNLSVMHFVLLYIPKNRQYVIGIDSGNSFMSPTVDQYAPPVCAHHQIR